MLRDYRQLSQVRGYHPMISDVNLGHTFSSNSDRTSVKRDRTDLRVAMVSSLVSGLPMDVVVMRLAQGACVEDMVIDKAGNRENGSSSSSSFSLVSPESSPSLVVDVR